MQEDHMVAHGCNRKLKASADPLAIKTTPKQASF